ncbi:MAG: CDP-diacylglycerol--glycerol-3-phosphate 3-phosphatidyltransferase [Burkholderiales bacterium]|nr:CDP-diacylglycerol--glycerol-3-phosphate 3-phosphatidyltransferase [Burkholderiales bacterium]
MQLNIPNLLTLLRILLIPLVVGVFYLPDAWLSIEEKNQAATFMFVLAAVTDWLDGWLARRLDQQSAFGAFLDPVADKLMVAAALVVLVHLGRCHSIVALVIIGREIAISALREWMAQQGRARSVAVNALGKIKTIVQMIAIPLLLFHDNFLGLFDAHVLGQWFVWAAAALTLLSMLVYLRAAWPSLKG